jgi:hypothetical protein
MHNIVLEDQFLNIQSTIKKSGMDGSSVGHVTQSKSS